MPETIICCGGTAAPRGAAKVCRLSLGDGGNITLRIEAIEQKMVAPLPNVLIDLLEVATYVHAADQLVRRGGPTARMLGSEWRRDFRFVIPVREPDRWRAQTVRESLEQLLAFMSDENFRFEFVGLREPAPGSAYFDFGGSSDADGEADEIVLFSGGLDSLAGTVDRLSHGSSRLILVSHESANKIATRQRHLAKQLAIRFPGRVLHVPVKITKRGEPAIERTQRTRSFLFGALAAAVGQIANTGRLRLFENGVVSLNLPIAPQLIGATATRTTHPRVIRDLSVFLTALFGEGVKVENPYVWRTKTEVAAILRASSHADLVRHSVSCSRVHQMAQEQTHCGCCSQCLDRRFGTLAAKLGDDDPASLYSVDLLVGRRDRQQDRTMAESFVRHAQELERLGDKEFMLKFTGEATRAIASLPGRSADDAVTSIADLHRRHGAAIVGVLKEGIVKHAGALARGTLPGSCILRWVAGREGIALPKTLLATQSHLDQRGRETPARPTLRLALDPSRHLVLLEGLMPVAGQSSFALICALVEARGQDRQAGRAPENYAFVSTRDLCRQLSKNEATLRRRVLHIRKRVARACSQKNGFTVDDDAVVQTRPWHGYRLNPAVLVIDIREVRNAGSRNEPEEVTISHRGTGKAKA